LSIFDPLLPYKPPKLVFRLELFLQVIYFVALSCVTTIGGEGLDANTTTAEEEGEFYNEGMLPLPLNMLLLLFEQSHMFYRFINMHAVF